VFGYTLAELILIDVNL